MKVAVPVCADSPAVVRLRVADYLELTKPRIAVMVLITVAVGYAFAAGPLANVATLFHTLLGTALVASGASALNQWLERHTDARMVRTENRPLPAGRLQPAEVLLFGSLLGIGGTAYLALTLPHIAAALVALLTFALYVFVYTPLKPLTTANTLIGAIPGALPPVIGWCAARGSISGEGIALFMILFLWQIPHFFAIAWIHREEYARAGLKMLPSFDHDGSLTGRTMLLFCLALITASLVPVVFGASGVFYLIGATLLGLWFLLRSAQFLHTPTDAKARKVLYASLIYLPVVLLLLVLDGPLTH